MKQKKDKFKCRDCGYCCTLIVELTNKEIEQIKKAGYDEEEFAEVGPSGKKRIKLKNYYCYFLGLHRGETFCRIYKARPKICRDYPFLKAGTEECFPPRLFDDDMFIKLDKRMEKIRNADRTRNKGS